MKYGIYRAIFEEFFRICQHLATSYNASKLLNMVGNPLVNHTNYNHSLNDKAFHLVILYCSSANDDRYQKTLTSNSIMVLLSPNPYHLNHYYKTLLLLPFLSKRLIKYLYNLCQIGSIDYPKSLYQKEIERLTIELSWKSSQIEGNTYSLLETERLFKEKMVAPNKPKEDATMLLNHKDALNYLLLHTDIAKTLNLRLIEEIHSFLISELGVDRNIRSRTVGITGSAYKPIDNQFQIREAVEHMCRIINLKENIFEKALLALVLISYIQPFEDGNKRTGRMISNALLIAGDMCPLSYRSVDSIEYKKAMLLFYEQNNLYAFKNLFIEQIEFSVKNYFQ